MATTLKLHVNTKESNHARRAFYRHDNYARALWLLIERGGTWYTRPTRILIVDQEQYQAFVDAGLVPPEQANGAKKKTKSKNKKETGKR